MAQATKSPATNAGALQLIRDIQNKTFAPLYLISGDETYQKERYLRQLKRTVVDPTFADFNLIPFEGKTLTPDQLIEAIDSCPAMADKKLVIVTDFDLYKPPAGFAEILPSLLSDLPEYLCLVFYYDILDGKPDKRTKIYKTLEKLACFAVFDHLPEKELIAWIDRRARRLNRTISPQIASHLIFLCGNSMTNLLGEIEKAAAHAVSTHATSPEIQKNDIDAVCSRVLEAVVFDLTDAITAGQFDKAVALVGDLIAQKNNEVMIFTTITRHIQRLYAAKLYETVFQSKRGDESLLMELLGSKSPYYARQIQRAAQRVSLPWLRHAASLCAQTDSTIKGSAVNPQKQIELALLAMATGGSTPI